MMEAMRDRRRRSLTLLIFFLIAWQLSGATSSRSVQGYVFEVLPEGSFRLESGLLVTLLPSTKIERENHLYSGSVKVGWEVRVTGRFDAAANTLQADRVTILPNPTPAVEGTAVVEERHDGPEGIVLVADGGKLLVSGRTRFLPPTPEPPESVKDPNAVQPGVFVHYRGRGTETGLVELTELSAWNNRLEEKERSLYQTYEPEMLLPAEGGAGPVVLKVGPNRYPVLDDREIQLYMDRLGTRLLPQLSRPGDATNVTGHKFWFVVVVQERPQASSFPSGVVVVHTSLFRLAENEAQLAFAIAHEIAHVTQEHSWREYQYHRRKLRVLRWSTAGMGYVVESAIRRGYQRDLEEQADRLALWYMTQAGYDPREAIRFLRLLERHPQGLSGLLWETHRSYGRRRRGLMAELARYSARRLDYSALAKDSSEFVLFRSRLPRAKINSVREADLAGK